MSLSTPFFSIVIPTFARPERLRACLDGVTRLDVDRASFEVIVADDGSPEPLDDVVAPFHNAIALRLVRQLRGGPAAARNAGAAVARGQFLVFIDDDCSPAPNWLSVLAGELARDGQRLLGGRVENALTNNPYSEASEQIGHFVYDYSRSGEARERFFTTNNIAMSRELFGSLGGFNTDIPSATAEDKEFCDRWQARGLGLSHVPEAVVYHAHDLTFRRFLRQHFEYGRGILVFRLLRRARTKSDLVPEPLGFYVGLVLSPVRARGAKRRWRSALLILAAQLATAAGALTQALRGNARTVAPVHPHQNTREA